MKTKTTLMISCIAASLLLNAYNANAQASSKKFSFGFGLEAGLVAGNYKEIYKAAGGITLRASYKAGPGFATLTSGGIAYLPKSFEGEDLKAGLQIPVKAGYKYVIKEPFYAMAELGFSSFKYYFEGDDGELQSVSQTGFTYAPSLGIQAKTLDIGLRYEGISLTGSSLSALFLRVGFNF